MLVNAREMKRNQLEKRMPDWMPSSLRYNVPKLPPEPEPPAAAAPAPKGPEDGGAFKDGYYKPDSTKNLPAPPADDVPPGPTNHEAFKSGYYTPHAGAPSQSQAKDQPASSVKEPPSGLAVPGGSVRDGYFVKEPAKTAAPRPPNRRK
ncbi:hypothetical protein EIP91_003599 [Steccherinum ochraceum]|uniref:Uncharacterized protein n=1 Tax=Steccherinum ochraceum TaxID=92696 RepID=A0A4R0RLW0_9APHY|nr:hypothetical protein EIP91_003599 [Steccherinum ochraceum]